MASTSVLTTQQPQHVKLGQVVPFVKGKVEDGTRLAERIFEYVIKNIANGTFAPSEKISQRNLAKHLGVSQVPVREAMEKLQQSGWIDRFPQRGTFVKRFTEQEILDVFQIREMHEVAAVGILAERITREQLGELKNIADALQSANSGQHSEDYVVIDTQFHTQIIHLLGNERLDEIYKSVLLQTRSFMLMGAARVPFVWGSRMEDPGDPTSHKPIYEALEKGDAELVQRLMRRHIRAGCDLAMMIRKWLTESE